MTPIGGVALLVIIALIIGLMIFLPGKELREGLGKTSTGLLASMPSLVQKNFRNQYTNSIAANFPSRVITGNLIIVAVTQYRGTVLDVTDNQHNNYVPVTKARKANTSSDFVQMYYAKNVIGGVITVKATFSMTEDKNLGVFEYSGINTISPLDQVTSDTGLGNAPNGGVLNTAREKELYFVVGVDDNGNNSAPSAGTGYNLEYHEDDSSNHERFYSEERIVTQGSYLTDFSINAGSHWAVIGSSFKPVG